MMKIELVESGSFYGTIKEFEIDFADLDKEEEVKLNELIAKSGILLYAKFSSREAVAKFLTKGLRDGVQYRFTLESIDTDNRYREYCIIYDQETLPVEAQPLLDYIKEHGVK